MNKTERIPFHVDVNRIIEVLAKQIYQSPLALLRENCQNAYDAILQRAHLNQNFEPKIEIVVETTQISVTDNGIGMTASDLVNHFWRAGSSGKNNPEARAAGVVGTFGIGAMANFGIASELTVVTESATNNERRRCHAERATLSASEDCIDIIAEDATGEPGTTIIAKIDERKAVNIAQAVDYLRQIVGFLTIPVFVNGKLVSQEQFEASVPKPPAEFSKKGIVSLSNQVTADVELVIGKTGDVWVKLESITYSGRQINGTVFLRQGQHQIRTFRTKFALAAAAVSSSYGFGGIADLGVLEPTAGREALTTSSIQLLQELVTEAERYVSNEIAQTPMANLNTNFMEWVSQHNKYALCSNLEMRMEPNNEAISLQEIKERTVDGPMNYFEGSDESLIKQYATDDKPLLVVSTRQPRRKCESNYLQKYCSVVRVANAPSVLGRKAKREWSMAESAFALRMISILESDYFVAVQVEFGKLSHGLSVLVDTSKSPPEIVQDSDSSTIATILRLYDEDFSSLTGMVKDYVRNVIFPKISSLVPSSTRQGAEAVLRAMRRPKDVFEYESSDLGSLTDLWQEYLSGKISLEEVAQQSTLYVQTNYQYVEQSATRSVASVLPDVLENQRILNEAESSDSGEEFEPLPAITRLDTESFVKLLTIEEGEEALKGYRCFIALSDRVRQNRTEFFLQPHRTEIVWGGQKALYIFQHHSGEFGLYYELQGTELLSEMPGGRSFPTCTIVVKNQIYIPVPSEIQAKFIPSNQGRKRFEIRCEILYPDAE